jgi:hypothetical protein
VAALSVAGVVVLGASPAFACSCASGAVEPRLADADAAFVGVAAVAPFEPAAGEEPTAQETWEFDVTDVYKGQLQPRIFVITPQSGGACGLDTVAVGDDVGMLLYRDEIDGSKWTTNLCAQVEPAELRAAGEPHEPISAATPAAVPDRNDPEWGLIAILAGALVATALIVYFVRERRRGKPAT